MPEARRQRDATARGIAGADPAGEDSAGGALTGNAYSVLSRLHGEAVSESRLRRRKAQGALTTVDGKSVS
ncbi:MAG: hypothetical protein V2G42_07050 [bacterium JZ-2024 1]